jgi:hypothetical protein
MWDRRDCTRMLEVRCVCLVCGRSGLVTQAESAHACPLLVLVVPMSGQDWERAYHLYRLRRMQDAVDALRAELEGGPAAVAGQQVREAWVHICMNGQAIKLD